MKTNNYILIISYFLVLLIIAASCKQAKETIVGRWSAQFPDGNEILVVFREDGTHDWFINNKLFSSGQSTVHQDTFITADPICNAAYRAAYTLRFITADTLRFTVVQDTCQPRRRDLNGLVLSRLHK